MKAIIFNCIDNFGKTYKYVVVCADEDEISAQDFCRRGFM